MDTVIGINPSEKVSAADIANGKGFALGTVGRIDATSQKVYKFVKYNDGTSAIVDIAIGDVLVYWAATGYTANEATADNSDGGALPIGAGVNQHDASSVDIATGDGIWVQIKGPATVTAIAAGADGNGLTCAGAADRGIEVIGGVTEPLVGYAEDDSALTIVCDFPY